MAVATLALLFPLVLSSSGQEKKSASTREKALYPIASVTGKIGYVDISGKVVIEPQFDRAFDFSDGRALVWENGKSGFIDTSGRLVIRKIYDDASEFSEGLAPVAVGCKLGVLENAGCKWGVIDTSGHFVIKPQFAWLGSFRDGYAAVRLKDEGKVGIVNRKGKVVTKPRFETVHPFSDGMALVEIGVGKWGYINERGRVVLRVAGIPECNNDCYEYSEGLVFGFSRPDERAVGYYDKTGKLSIRAPYHDAGPFTEGLAAVLIGEKWGYIDRHGKLVIPPKFDEAWPFQEGLASVAVGKKWGFINKKGETVITPQFDSASPFREGLAAVTSNVNYGYVNRAGRVVVWGESPLMQYAPDTPTFDVNFTSAPAGATVYLIPKLAWQNNGPRIAEMIRNHEDLDISIYKVNKGTTPIRYQVRQMVYMIVFELNKNLAQTWHSFEPRHDNDIFLKDFK